MAWTTLVWRWWVEAALGGTVVLALGSIAVKACRQPVQRARIVVLTVLGCFLAPWLGSLPFAPRWSAGLHPMGRIVEPSDRGELGAAGDSVIQAPAPRLSRLPAVLTGPEE